MDSDFWESTGSATEFTGPTTGFSYVNVSGAYLSCTVGSGRTLFIRSLQAAIPSVLQGVFVDTEGIDQLLRERKTFVFVSEEIFRSLSFQQRPQHKSRLLCLGKSKMTGSFRVENMQGQRPDELKDDNLRFGFPSTDELKILCNQDFAALP